MRHVDGYNDWNEERQAIDDDDLGGDGPVSARHESNHHRNAPYESINERRRRLGFPRDIELIQRAQRKDTRAMRELTWMYEPLIDGRARRFASNEEEFEDLKQQGTLAFMQAVHDFDGKKGSLASYAARTSSNLKKLMHATEELRMELQRDPSLVEIAVRCGFSEERVRKLRELSHRYPIRSLDQVSALELSDAEAREAMWHDATSGEFPIDGDGNTERKQDLRIALQMLRKRHRLAYLLRQLGNWTYRKIGKLIGVSKQRAQQLDVEAGEEIRAFMHKLDEARRTKRE
jgi:DNA-directed RNA polymerase specialized sigma subunit